jgi:hypothetical protein
VPDLKYVGSSVVVARKLKDDWGCAAWHIGNMRGIKFLPLAELRARFDKKHGAQDWPEDDSEWQRPTHASD